MRVTAPVSPRPSTPVKPAADGEARALPQGQTAPPKASVEASGQDLFTPSVSAGGKGLMPYGNALDPRNQAALHAKANTPAGRAVIAMADGFLKSSPDPIRGIFKPEPFYLPGKDGVPNPNRDQTQLRQLSRFTKQMNSLCHAYALTGNTKYADKAISIMDAWAHTTKPGFGSGQAGISSYHPLSSVFTSMKALKDYPGWKPESKAKVMDWVSTYGKRALFGGDKYNNRHNWRMLFIASTAALTGNKELLRQQASEWRDAVAHTVRESDGLLPEELKRTRSLHYHLYALKPMMAMAELARSEGIELYNTREGGLMRKALEAVAPGVIDQKQWHHKEIRSNAGAGSEALYALAAERFGSNLLRSTSATLQERAAHRPGELSTRVARQMADGAEAGFPLPNMMLFG